MNHPQSSQKPLQNGGVRRGRIDKDVVSRSDNLNWRQPSRSTSNSTSNSNSSTQGGSKGAHDRLVYMYTCLIGQHVEVQRIDGHVYAGIFHTAVFDKDFGVIVKMARLVKDGAHSTQGESVREAARKPPIKKLQIQGKDFVQIIATDVSLSGDASSSSRSRENRSEIVTDSAVSQGWHRESERELKPWKPDDESSDTTNFSLSNLWSGGNWDQFEANKALFGVETTFDEELYTTKLIRGPQMHEREREAQRIAREIQGQQTRNLHLAEERGILAPELDALDEEARYSAVRRGYPDEGDDDEDHHIDDHNDETFGGTITSVGTISSQNSSSSSAAIPGQVYAEESSTLPAEPQSVGGSSRSENSREHQDQPLEKEDSGSSDIFPEKLRLRKLSLLNCGDKNKHPNKGSGSPYNSPRGRGSPLMSPSVGDQSGIKALNLDPSCPQVSADVIREFQEFKQLKYREQVKAQFETFKELEPRSPGAAGKGSVGDTLKEGNAQPASHDVKSNLAPIPAAVQRIPHVSAPPPSSLPLPTNLSSLDKPGLVCTIPSRNAASMSPSSAQTSRAFSTSQTQTASTPNSPSSSTASLSAGSLSKKSPLNAHAKEFKLNPNAKAFTPSTPPARPPASQQHPVVVQSPVYSMHSGVPAATSMPGSHVNLPNITQHNQFPPYNHAVPSPVVASNPASYMQPWVPGYPVVGGGGILPAQRATHSQQQPMPSFGHPQPVKFPMQSSSSPMPPALSHPNGQLFPPHLMYGPQANPVIYMPYQQK